MEKSVPQCGGDAIDTVAVPVEQWNDVCGALQCAAKAFSLGALPQMYNQKELAESFKNVIEATSKGSPGDKVRSILLDRGSLLPPCSKAAQEHYVAQVLNTVDTKYIKGWGGKTAEQTERRMRKREFQVIKLVSLTVRMKDQRAAPPLILMDSLERVWQGVSKSDWQRQSKDGSLMSPEWIATALKSVEGFIPPPALVTGVEGQKYSNVYSVSVRDNLEFWIRIKWSRHVDGEKKETEVLHTVTGYSVPPLESLVMEAVPVMENWPFQNNWDMMQAILSDAGIDENLSPMWRRAITLHEDCELDYVALLRRPPPAADHSPHRPPTFMFANPIIMDCGTSSYEDAIKIVDAVRKDNAAMEKHIIWGDMQTMFRLWHLKANHKAKYNDMVPVAGEFHAAAHFLCAVVIINWKYIYEPIVHLMGIKSLNLKCIMKEHDVRYRWTIIILTAGLTWLKAIFTREEMEDPKLLLSKVHKNTPVSDFIGFLYYHACPVLAHKQAMQTNDVASLNFMWKYSLMAYAPTGKYNYKKGVLMQCKVLFDAELNVNNILEGHRTCTGGGHCRGAAFDYMNEKVFPS
jgi:hypothetical protein